jgi:hypothetical protein
MLSLIVSFYALIKVKDEVIVIGLSLYRYSEEQLSDVLSLPIYPHTRSKSFSLACTKSKREKVDHNDKDRALFIVSIFKAHKETFYANGLFGASLDCRDLIPAVTRWLRKPSCQWWWLPS